MRNFLIVLFYIGFGSLSAHANEMTIAEAYIAQNHQQTQFDMSRAKMDEAEAKYLDHLFFVTDIAFRERMVMLGYFHDGQDAQYIDTYNKEISNALASFAFIKAPTRMLTKIEVLIVTAILEQKTFFNKWHNARGTPLYNSLSKNYMSHALVQASHAKLMQAYGLLKRKYRSETMHNQQSFYDHLCVLDFI